MKRIASTIFALVLLFAATSAYGYTFNYYPGFGTSVFDGNNNTSPINYPGVGYLPSPGNLGEGGEAFDEEGMFLANADGKLYGALSNSFGDKAWSAGYNDYYATGHLFFGFNGAYDQFALDLESGKLYQVAAWDYITNKPGTYYPNTSVRDQVGAYRMSQGVEIGTLSDFMMTKLDNYEGIVEGDPPLAGSNARDVYVYEWSIDLAMLSPYVDGDLQSATFHHTLECGNDLIEKDIAMVPEPGTMALLGIGLIGAGVVRRRRRNVK